VKVAEHALRFALGGTITVLTGLVAHELGPLWGGVCLAFPAILPASATLVDRREGRRAAVDDCRGATDGAIGMAAFAAVMWLTASRVHASVALGLAALAWAGVSFAVWKLRTRD
jgi:uncharacterized membrane protein (GlpM family)